MLPDAPLFDLRGRRVLVSGASGGIGGHLAALCARRGAAVALASRRVDALEPGAAALRDQGWRAVAVPLDVTSRPSIVSALDEAQNALGGPVDVLVNNAAVLELSRFLDLDEASLDRTLDTNLKGATLLAQEAARRMVAARCPGSIVNVGSVGGLRPGPWTAAYAASKAGLMHLTQVMAVELARKGIRVNALCPGNVDTAMIASMRSQHEAWAARTPLGRLGRPDDLDGAFLLLASEAGRYMTGSVITVDGGLALSWV